MKVMFLNASQEGGAAKAALRLMKGVQDKGVDARLIVQLKSGRNPSVIGPQTKIETAMGFILPRIEWLCVGLYARRRGCMFSPAMMPDRLPSRVARFGSDIIHLHWVANAFMRVETLRLFNRPLIWTLHDSWAFTGGCHVPLDCTRYQRTCGKCPALSSSFSLDPSRWLWRRKQKAWRGLDLTVVTPSRWLGKCAQASSLFRNVRIEVIPNGLDLQLFKPVDKRLLREELSLPQEKKLVLFGGKSVTSDPNKGVRILAQSLRGLAERGWRDTAEVVVFGESKPKRPPDFGLKVHYMGWLNDDAATSRLYAAADVSVVPSLQENLSYTTMESMACGTPCVAFDQGGMPDMIESGHTGYLARPHDPGDLAQGIAWVLENEDRRKNLSLQARIKVEQEFSLDTVADRYVKLYGEMVKNAE